MLTFFGSVCNRSESNDMNVMTNRIMLKLSYSVCETADYQIQIPLGVS